MLPALLLVCVMECMSFELSNTFGNHMVLQREPFSATVWGFADQGVSVQTTFDGQQYTAQTDQEGVWRQPLPPKAAGGPYTLEFAASDGNAASLNDVLFGDVFLVGGQSNAEFTLITGLNATEEIADADRFPDIRVFTVGTGTSSETPLRQLGSIRQLWAVGSAVNVGGGHYQFHSALGWFFGREVYNYLGGTVPIGLISNNWGGTSVQQWSSDESMRACGRQGAGNLYNAMIQPYIVGPMTVKGMLWYQGESNIGDQDFYACAVPAMLTDYRHSLQNDELWFGFVQLAGYGYGSGSAPGDLMISQLSVLAMPHVGWSTAVDLGELGDIHPLDKQNVALRLAHSGLTMMYGADIAWQYPTYHSSQSTREGDVVTISVSFAPGSVGSALTAEVPEHASRNQAHICIEGLPDQECGHARVHFDNGAAVRATASISADGQGLLLQAQAPAGATAIASEYGRASWPVTLFFNDRGLPVTPWYMAVGQDTTHAKAWSLASAANYSSYAFKNADI